MKFCVRAFKYMTRFGYFQFFILHNVKGQIFYFHSNNFHILLKIFTLAKIIEK